MFVLIESIFVIFHKIRCIKFPAVFKHADWRWFCRVETRSKLLAIFVWWLVWSIIFSGNIYQTAWHYILEYSICFWWSCLIMEKERDLPAWFSVPFMVKSSLQKYSCGEMSCKIADTHRFFVSRMARSEYQWVGRCRLIDSFLSM